MERRGNQPTGGQSAAVTPAAEVIPAAPSSTIGGEMAIFRGDRADVLNQLAETFSGGHVNVHRDFERIKNPTSGGNAFKVVTLDGEKYEEVIRGVIIAWREARMFWDKPYGVGGKQPPACSSTDGITGVGTPGGDCSRCAFSQPGSKLGPDGNPSKASACREVRQLLLMRGQSLLPEVVNVTPGSLNQIVPYQRRLMTFGVPYWSVVTEIYLSPEKNDGGIEYSQLRFRRLADSLTPDQQQVSRKLNQIFQPALRTIALDAKDYTAVTGVE